MDNIEQAEQEISELGESIKVCIKQSVADLLNEKLVIPHTETVLLQNSAGARVELESTSKTIKELINLAEQSLTKLNGSPKTKSPDYL